MNDRAIKNLAGGVLALLLAVTSTTASAWWDKDWNSRKQIAVDAAATGADVRENLQDAPLLVRLHAGNFGFFSELAKEGNDLRWQLDDRTPAHFHIEKFDAAGEIALVWVKLPRLAAQANTDAVWLYYGNAAAAAGADAGATYDTPQALVYHFDDSEAAPHDATAYGNNAQRSTAAKLPAGLIGAGAAFDGNAGIEVASSPSLAIDPGKGWTFSAWLRSDASQSATVFEARDADNRLALRLQGNALIADLNGRQSIEAPAAQLEPGKWRHVALVLQRGELILYVDGARAASGAVDARPFAPTLSIGSGWRGALDELGIAGTARSEAWIRFLARSQNPDVATLAFGDDETNSGAGESGYFAVIMQNVTVDGWVVIALTGVMFVVAALVIVLKSSTVNQVRRANRIFLDRYAQADAAESLAAAAAKDLSASTLYRLYQLGNREYATQLAAGAGSTAEDLNLVQVRLDAAVVREAQSLNRNMVLLTIAIAGGPFLGLLGTVMGVMITFAAIAATGDVNINAIAPGIAAALAATVAGLAVAIPALFGYNYLLTLIKDITADMRVFSDEFVAALAARRARAAR